MLTTHRKFECVMVLCLSFRGETLRRFVDLETLRVLITHTINFLRGLAPIYEFCRNACNILERVPPI